MPYNAYAPYYSILSNSIAGTCGKSNLPFGCRRAATGLEYRFRFAESYSVVTVKPVTSDMPPACRIQMGSGPTSGHPKFRSSQVTIDRVRFISGRTNSGLGQFSDRVRAETLKSYKYKVKFASENNSSLLYKVVSFGSLETMSLRFLNGSTT